MAESLHGRVALVTGAGRGIGRATALQLARQGAVVVLSARSEQQLEEVAAEIATFGGRALAVPADVTDETAVKRVVEQTAEAFGGLHILVNNAGASVRATVKELEAGVWQRILQTNATGTYLCSRAALPFMRAAGWGRIVNVVSGNGRQGQACNSAYAASKFAVMGFSESLAQEVLADNITVTAVLPGPTDTDLRAAAAPGEDRSLLLSAEDVAEVILFIITRPDNVVIAEVPVRPRRYASGVA